MYVFSVDQETGESKGIQWLGFNQCISDGKAFSEIHVLQVSACLPPWLLVIWPLLRPF